MQKNFVLLGVGGFVAPRHLKAIKETGNRLLAALDPSDSVGIIDSFFPDAAFFTEFERFDRHVEKLKRSGIKIDYVSICTPNYLHDAHIRFGLRHGADVICEKPLVLNPWNLDPLKEIEKETRRRIFTILQLRLHPVIQKLKESVLTAPKDKIFEVELTYITSRGNWYYASWKGDISKSGGIATNIGIHFFDMLLWVFGEVKSNTVHLHTHDRAAGYLVLEKAKVKWFMSISLDTLPQHLRDKGLTRHRALEIDGEDLDFTGGFEALHTNSYKEILNDNGYPVDTAKAAIDLAYNIRIQKPTALSAPFHKQAATPPKKHPFGDYFNQINKQI